MLAPLSGRAGVELVYETHSTTTDNENGTANLAPFSFFTGASAEPPTCIICVSRRGKVEPGTKKDTWTNIERLYLNHYVKSTGASTVAFMMRVRRGVKLRVFLNNAAARPDYVRGWSNFVVT